MIFCPLGPISPTNLKNSGMCNTNFCIQYMQCGKPFFSNTRQNGELTETNTRQNETDLAMFGE